MDIVITYVDGLDPLWVEDYRSYVDEAVNTKRFRDWGTLKYLLRGIQTCMPFIRNVYLVVARQSQIPAWADETRLHIVLHEDIIPKEYLPTFNSTTIEMFLHRIPGLDEQYIYFNDDIFPLLPCSATDFFDNDRAVAGPARQLIVAGNLFRKQTRNADALARRAAGLRPSLFYLRPQHTCSAMLRSCCEELSDKMQPEILRSLSRTRTEANISQYVFTDYFCHIGRTVRRRISNKHFSLAVTSMEKICAYIADPDRSFVCINDVNLPEDVFNRSRAMLLDALEARFPSKSSFEI